MAIQVIRRILPDTNVFIDYLRTNAHAHWISGGAQQTVRFLSAVVLMELRLGADTPKRKRAVDRIQTAFVEERIVTPTPLIFNRAAQVFRAMYGTGTGLPDRLAPMNDILIALTASHIGAIIVTGNLLEFKRIATKVPGLRIIAPT